MLKTFFTVVTYTVASKLECFWQVILASLVLRVRFASKATLVWSLSFAG
jgi:hypothetical protein